MIKKRNHRFVYIAVIILIVLVVMSFAGVFVEDLAGEASRKYRKSAKKTALKTVDNLIDKDFRLEHNHVLKHCL